MKNKYKALVFDVDGTVVESCQVLSGHMLYALANIVQSGRPVIFMSGTDNTELLRMVGQKMIDTALTKPFYLAGNSGAEIYKITGVYQELVFRRSLKLNDKADILKAVANAIKKFELSCEIGEQVIDRGNQITLSCIGRKAPSAEKAEWDPDCSKRSDIANYIQSKLGDNYTVTIAGTTSIDILAESWDKSNGVRKIAELEKISLDDIIFFGDKCQPGGNDYPAASIMDHFHVKDPDETLNILQTRYVNC